MRYSEENPAENDTFSPPQYLCLDLKILDPGFKSVKHFYF